MRARHNRTLAQALHEAHGAQPIEVALASGDRHQKAEHRIDQHAPAEEAQGAVLLRQNSERNLRDHVAVEERGQDVRLIGVVPVEFALAGVDLSESVFAAALPDGWVMD